MDTTIRNGAVDAPTAKAAARNVKQRLAVLGHEISLNHAYEAVAAMSGYPTWSVMKAKLEASVAFIEEPVENDTAPFPEGIAWDRMAMGEYNPTMLVFGPDDLRRNEIMKSVANKWLATYSGRYDIVPFMRMIAFTPSPVLAFDGLTGFRTVRSVGKFHLRASKGAACLDIFDLPLGRRVPTERHKARIVAYLLSVVTGQDPTLAADAPALTTLLSQVVDAIYDRLSDRVKGGQPRRYSAGVVRFVDQAVDAHKIGHDEDTTWWEMSEELAYRQLISLAEWAQAQTRPRLEDVMRCVTEMDISFKASSGETLGHAVVRCVSRALRDLPFVRGFDEFREDRHSRLGIIEIERSGDDLSDRLMLLQAINHYEMLTDDISDPSARQINTDRPRPHAGSPMRLVIAGVGAAMKGMVKTCLEAAIETDRECVVFTDDIEVARELEPGSATLIVSGCARHE